MGSIAAGAVGIEPQIELFMTRQRCRISKRHRGSTMKRRWLLAPIMLAAFAWAGAQTSGSTGSGIGGSSTSTGAGTTANATGTMGSQNTQAGATVGTTAGTTPGSTVGRSTTTN